MNRPRILIFLLSILLCPMTSNAQQALDQDVFNEIDQDIKEILKSPEFDPWEIQETWKLKKKKEDKKNVNNRNPDPGFLVKIAEIIASVLPWLLILSLVIILIAILIIKKKNLISFFKSLSLKNKKEKSAHLQGMRIEKSILPSEIIQTAKQLWKAGNSTQALSLIYRGALSYFTNEMHIPIPASATEDECFYQVKRSLFGQTKCKKLLKDFFNLIRIWLYSAYADKHPGNTRFKSLCICWDKYFKG